ncbi:MAG: ISAzo13 family transposase [Chloroflexi bacterium]|nr:ISAzo13 family transposase [Chloroflexota bacterium]
MDRKTIRKLTCQLRRQFRVGRTTIGRLLQRQRYTQHVNRKRLSRKQDPQRDEQMRYIACQRRRFQRQQLPVISVDTKKKELIGLFRNAGRTWRQQPLDVLSTDFARDASGKAVPYGIYDATRNAGYVAVGTSHETPAFAIAAIRSWWVAAGRHDYSRATALLIEADSGGANGNRCWLWKAGLQTLADEFGLSITVTHYPTAASKWNPIEHRLFSQISRNWAGQPLLSFETVLKYIRTTTTESGLRCRAHLDRRRYKTRLKVTVRDKAQINFGRPHVRPHYNYTIHPRTGTHKKVSKLFPVKPLPCQTIITRCWRCSPYISMPAYGNTRRCC